MVRVERQELKIFRPVCIIIDTETEVRELRKSLGPTRGDVVYEVYKGLGEVLRGEK